MKTNENKGKQSRIELIVFNLWEQVTAGRVVQQALSSYHSGREAFVSSRPASDIPETVRPQETKAPGEEVIQMPSIMPVLSLDGISYIGVLYIFAPDLELPILSELTDANLKIAPCLYQGTTYQDNIILAGHDYRRHFVALSKLKEGDTVRFADVEGTEICCTVDRIEFIDEYAIDEMLCGDWDMTVFTCTVGGQSRVTVRCKRADAAS